MIFDVRFEISDPKNPHTQNFVQLSTKLTKPGYNARCVTGHMIFDVRFEISDPKIEGVQVSARLNDHLKEILIMSC